MAFAEGLEREEREERKGYKARNCVRESEMYLGISLVAQASGKGPHKTKKRETMWGST